MHLFILAHMQRESFEKFPQNLLGYVRVGTLHTPGTAEGLSNSSLLMNCLKRHRILLKSALMPP